MIGVVDLETNLTTTHYHGMAHGIEGLAYDWLRGSLYWTDSALMWLMVTDASFRHYATVYRSQNPLYGLSIHVRTRSVRDLNFFIAEIYSFYRNLQIRSAYNVQAKILEFAE